MLQDVEKIGETNKHPHRVQKLPTLKEKRGGDILTVKDQAPHCRGSWLRWREPPWLSGSHRCPDRLTSPPSGSPPSYNPSDKLVLTKSPELTPPCVSSVNSGAGTGQLLSKSQQRSPLVASPELLTGWSPSEPFSHSYTEHRARLTVGAQ